MRGFTIREDAERIRNQPDTLEVGWVTPEEAEGRVVAFEPPGQMGREVFRIVDVNLDDEETLLENVHTGTEYLIGDGAFPPNYDRFQPPRMGETFTVAWKEHLAGNGEWVQTTPELRSDRDAYTYYGHYQGHEETRVVEQTFEYTSTGVVKAHMWYDREDELTIQYSGEIQNADKVFNLIDTDAVDKFDSVGEVFINREGEIVYYDIKDEYKAELAKNRSPVRVLENYQL